MRSTLGGVVLAGGVLALAGCTSPAQPEASSSPVVVPSPAVTATTAGPGVGVPPVDLPSTTAPRSCSDRVLGAKTVHLTGSRGSLHWDLAIPEFSGASSAAEVNRHVRASAQDAIDLGLREGRGDDGVRRDVEGEGLVTTSDRRTVQVELTWIDNLAGTAHPSDHVATTVVTTDTGRPLRLRDVLADESAALRTLSATVQEDLGQRVAPTEENFAAWQTTRDGLRLTFTDDQLGGRGLRSSTVRWSTVSPLLSDEGTGLLDPDVDRSTC